jgi:hypothetical protein
LVWFSCGAASAVLAKRAVERYGDACEVIYCDTMASEHPDNSRFFTDVERWIGRSIRRARSEKFTTVDDVFERTKYMSGPRGARCTFEMKKLPRETLQYPDDIHLFGYTCDEQRRADAFEDRNANLSVEWLLIDEGISKADCYTRIAAAGIALPEMYQLGFDHNNCLGCVKATSPRYWNAVREHFPDVFARRATQSALLGVRLARVSRAVGETIAGGKAERRKGKIVSYRIHLTDLPPDATGPREDIECGPVCQTPAEGSSNG